MIDWLIALPMLVVSLVAILIIIVDLLHPFGWNPLPELPKEATPAEKTIYDAEKVVMLIVATMALALSADRLLHYAKSERMLEEISEDLTVVRREAKASVVVLATREEFFAEFEAALSNAPHYSKVFISHYEKLKMVYSAAESPAEESLLALWKRRIESGDIDVEQLVHVTSTSDLEEAWERCRHRELLPNFHLSVNIGLLPNPYVEYVVVGEDNVLLALSTQPASPWASDFGIRIRSQLFAAKMIEFFRMWEGQFTVPLKTRDSLQESNYAQFADALPEGHPLELPRDLDRMILQAARHPASLEATERIGEAFRKLERITVPAFYERAIEELYAAIAVLEETADGRLVMAEEGVYSLLDLVGAAESHVWAVCPQGAIQFWKTDLGSRLVEQSRLAVEREVDVRRIFIMENGTSNSELDEIIQAQLSAGIRVFLASFDGDISAAPDFLLVDGAVAFEDCISPQRNSAMDVSPEEIRRLERLWQRMSLGCQELTGRRTE